MTDPRNPTVEGDLVETEIGKTCVWCSGPVVRAEKWAVFEGVYQPVLSTTRCRWCLRHGGAFA